MTLPEIYTDKFLSLYGNVKRCRGSYIYTAKGKRITDMYMNSGRAILGWKSGNAMTLFKNVFDRSILADLPNDYVRQLSSALQKLFPYAKQFFVFSSDVNNDEDKLPVFRPWEKLNFDIIEESQFVFYPPFGFGQVSVIVSNIEQTVENEKYSYINDKKIICDLPSPLCAALSRSIYDLISELPKRTETDFSVFDEYLFSDFDRNGPYLYPKCSRGDYEKLFLSYLEAGLLLSPDYDFPSIIPFGANPGDLKKVRKIDAAK